MNPENKDERRVGENRGRFLARRWLEVLRELPRTPEDKREIQAALPATRSSVAQHVMKDTTSDGLMESRVGSEEEAQCAKIVMPAKSAKRQGHLVEGGGARTFAFSSIQVFVHVYISAQIIRTFPILLAVPVRCQAKRSRTFGLRTPLDMAGQEQKERLMKALARYLSRGGGRGPGLLPTTPHLIPAGVPPQVKLLVCLSGGMGQLGDNTVGAGKVCLRLSHLKLHVSFGFGRGHGEIRSLLLSAAGINTSYSFVFPYL